MKKTYTKPEISFESFLVSTNIAGSCEFKTMQMAEGQCGYLPAAEDRWDQGPIFISGVNGCKFVEPSGKYGSGPDQLCYHNPTDLNNLFNS